MESAPHGGKLVQIDSVARSPEKERELLENVKIKVSAETKTQMLNISSGVLSPLDGFMGTEDYENVVEDMRLSNDLPWTIPILLHVPENFSAGRGDELTLVDEKDGRPLGDIEFDELFKISKKEYAKNVFGTEDPAHPGVAKIYASTDHVVSGKLKSVVRSDADYFENYTLTPKETRVLFKERGWKDVVAFQTRNAPHIGHEYLQKTALAFADGIFINPVIGKKKSGDFTDEVILDAYQALVKNYYPKNSVALSVLRYEMQYAGPREAIMHAIMRKNFGCTQIVIGRDHAGVGSFYGPYAAQEIFKEIPDLGIEPMFFKEFYYCKKCVGIGNEKICPHPESDRLTYSGTNLRKMFLSGETPPKEYMRPEVSKIILESKSAFVD